MPNCNEFENNAFLVHSNAKKVWNIGGEELSLKKSFRRQVVKSEKSVEYRVRKFFQKTFRSNHKKVWNIG